ncbi:hypothetical protein TRVA0_032S01266 [Trichomonascus vanleenenianus]|uniref:Nup35/Nup53 family RNA-binding protein n=1 Tax=Trichomonascus vanleenenianus TaxID=2268995 RepID=UPI003ECB159B
MFGANQNKPSTGFGGQGGGLFGNSAGPQTSNLFGQPNNTTTNTNSNGIGGGSGFGSNVSSASNSLFNSNSQSSGLTNSSLFGSNNSLASVNNSTTNNPLGNTASNAPGLLPQSQSSFNLAGAANSNSSSLMGSAATNSTSNTPGRQLPSAPSWGKQERRIIPSHMARIRQKSSFSTPERSALTSSSSSGYRHGSISAQSPPSTFGSTSFGTPKPTHAKKNNAIDEEDLPPTESVYDSGASPFYAKTQSLKASRPVRSSLNPSSSSLSITSSSSSSVANTPSTKPLNSLSSATNGNTDANSVVVYGFPPELTSSIVKHFSKYGEILENFASSGGTPSKHAAQQIHSGTNWIKITYTTPSSAARALAEDGTLFADKYMIGCKPYSSDRAKRLVSGSSFGEETTSDENGSLYPQIKENGKMPRTLSMPVLAGGKRIHVQDGQGLFNKKNRQVRVAPSMANVKERSDSKSGMKGGREGWLSWTSKRAQELIFGWDDL